MPDSIRTAVHGQAPLMGRVNDFVYAHPELGHEEHLCADFLAEIFDSLGLEVERPFAGMMTAFTATLRGREPGPKVGHVLLYDAVPSVGDDGAYRPNHSCGHNVISGAVAGAAAALAEVPRRGELVVMGLPGDEIGAPEVCRIGGGKSLSAAAGAWDDFDAVLYIHPEFDNAVSRVSRWMARYRLSLNHPRDFAQRGEAQGSVPWAIRDLLDAVRGLEAEDSQEFIIVKELRADGDVEGACDVNGRMQVLLYGLTRDEVTARASRLRRAVETVGENSGIAIELAQIGETYMGVKPNRALASVVETAMTEAELEVVRAPLPLPFATDFGNISHRAPGALIGAGREGGWKFHTYEGAREFGTEDARRVMMASAEILALSTVHLWDHPDSVERIRADFEAEIESGR